MDKLIKQLRIFARDRNWEQFHSPKNLAMALSVEVAEVVENFQWLTEEQSRNLNDLTLNKVKDEIGDVQIYVARLADQLGFSPIDAAMTKLKENEKKYPADIVRGSSKKYSDY